MKGENNITDISITIKILDTPMGKQARILLGNKIHLPLKINFRQSHYDITSDGLSLVESKFHVDYFYLDSSTPF